MLMLLKKVWRWKKLLKPKRQLNKFEQVIKEDPKHPKAYAHQAAWRANIGGRIPTSKMEEKRKHLEKARSYTNRAIEISPTDPDARLAHIISLGLLSEISRNPREKVLDAKLIHAEAKTIIEPRFTVW